MRYVEIKKNDVANGPGVRVSLWVAGCSHHCEGCFNESTWDFCSGKEFTDTQIEEIKNLLKNSPVKKNFSILGGDPLESINHNMLEKLLKELKCDFPNLNIWIWTGYKWEDIKHLQLLKYIDVLVDGEFILSQKNLKLKFRGSSNQRVIDVQKSLNEEKIITVDI